jgi:hypothetical protein
LYKKLQGGNEPARIKAAAMKGMLAASTKK